MRFGVLEWKLRRRKGTQSRNILIDALAVRQNSLDVRPTPRVLRKKHFQRNLLDGDEDFDGRSGLRSGSGGDGDGGGGELHGVGRFDIVALGRM